jgi:hypothetical protein
MAKAAPNYWVFSNKPAGSRAPGTIWDHAVTLQRKRYYFRENEKCRRRVNAGDVVFLRIFEVGFIGQFEAGDWHPADDWQGSKGPVKVGFFDMRRLELWKREVPHPLVKKQLSTKDVRSRIATITLADALIIQTAARRQYERPISGKANGDVVVLEAGLEEAIKPSLARLGLKPLSQQQSFGPEVGLADLIYEDRNGDIVIVESKRGRSSERAVGQIQKYMAAVRTTAPQGKNVHGWIVTGDYDRGLELAAQEAKIRLLRVRLP